MSEVWLVMPSLDHLPAYVAALERCMPDNVGVEVAIREELEKIAESPEKFLASLDDPAGKGNQIRLPNGAIVPCLPGFRRWVWDGEFCGSASACAGRRARSFCHCMCSAISAMPWCPGTAAAARRSKRWRCCCHRRGRRVSPMSS